MLASGLFKTHWVLAKGLIALLCAAALAVAGLVAPPQAAAADTPYLDDSFGERGRAVLDLGGNTWVRLWSMWTSRGAR